MKRKMLLALLCMVTIMASAQVSWNAKAGLNLSNMRGEGESGDLKVGYNLGVGMEYAFNERWSLQPSLSLTAKGTRESDGGTTVQLNAVYLELPVMAALRVPVSDRVNLVFGLGPYVAYGVGGKVSVSSDGVDISINTFGETEGLASGMRRFDAGLALGVSVEMGKFSIRLDEQLGLANVAASEGSGDSVHNNNISIGVGYRF
ncbi:MAG: PorT family protein [Prevotellaceae bacterium]|jgi:hypothetical protein|nr:PorT family protein [Prevotellaceae bacterium]